jgi:hypothetical protein
MTNMGFYFVVTVCRQSQRRNCCQYSPGLLYFGPLEELINFAFKKEVPVDPLPHLMQSSRRVKNVDSWGH